MASAVEGWAPHRQPPDARTSDSGLGDLLARLDASIAQRASAYRASKQRRLVKAEEVMLPGWQTPPSKEEVSQARRLVAMGVTRRPFRVHKGPPEGGDFNKEVFCNEPTGLNEWELARVIQPLRNYERPNQGKGYFQKQPEAFPPAADELCAPMHRQWLKEHHQRRDRELHPVYFALKRRDARESVAQKAAMERDITRAMMQRDSDSLPKMSSISVQSLSLTMKKLRVGVALAKKAPSSNDVKPCTATGLPRPQPDREPALRLRAETPAGQAKHLVRWLGPERKVTTLAETTPWQWGQEAIELKARPSICGVSMPRINQRSPPAAAQLRRASTSCPGLRRSGEDVTISNSPIRGVGFNRAKSQPKHRSSTSCGLEG